MAGAAPSEPWPPQCCVPAFVEAALKELGVASPHRATLAHELGVRVGRGQANPFALPVAPPSDWMGVSGVDSERKIDLLCRRLAPSIRFRHVPFLTIALEAWEDVLLEAQGKGAVVGVGVVYHRLVGRGPGHSDWHVLRIVGAQGRTISVLDDSGESTPAAFDVDRERLRIAVLAIPDGFWIVGPEDSMALQYTLPWRVSS